MARYIAAEPGDEERILALMKEFYLLERLPWDEGIARRALRELLGTPSLGRVVWMEEEGAVAGYAVLTFGFSLEFRGRDALVDELFVREPHRGRGIGTECLRRLEEVCRAEGIHALHLEVDRANARAKRLYRRAGYLDHDRYLLTKPLSGPPCPPC